MTHQPPADLRGLPFNVRPCARDPLFALLRGRLGLSPAAAAALFLAVYLAGQLIACFLAGTAVPREGLALSFTGDIAAWILYGFVIPAGMYVAMRFYDQVGTTFERLHLEGTVRAPTDEYNGFLKQLHSRYNHPLLQVVALLLSGAVYGWMVHRNATDGVVAWVDLDAGAGGLYHLPLGFVAWYAAIVLLLKGAITGAAMQSVFAWPVQVQPFHPDACGGLRLLTDISVTMALFNAIVALAMVMFVWAGVPLLSLPVLAAVILCVLTPALFAATLYSAHQAMTREKEVLLERVNERVRGPYLRLCAELHAGSVPSDAIEEVLHLDALHGFLRRLPVWPTNTQVLAQVVLSVAVPLVLLALQFALERLLGDGRAGNEAALRDAIRSLSLARS